MNRTQCDFIIEFVNSQVDSLGYRCIEAEWVADEHILRLYLENDKFEFDMEGCVRVTRLLNEDPRLDELIPGTYTLEVSSPGIERPLRSLKDFVRHVGQNIEVKLLSPADARKHGKGKIIEVQPGILPRQGDTQAAFESEDPVITLETSRGLWKFPFKALLRANLVYDWGQNLN
jgi:ribosome maturation factor RimP